LAETSVRQLIASGKEKTALDRAKDLHKACHDAASEALLIDAYVARIQSLSRQNLHLEAKALLDLVRERFPAAAVRLEGASHSTAARSGDLDPLLRTLADPAIPQERRAEIEALLTRNVIDLSAIASSTALQADHPLRQAAAAVERAFAAVTTGHWATSTTASRTAKSRTSSSSTRVTGDSPRSTLPTAQSVWGQGC
jgi:hypothetical protein